jgi:hypothetical protein
MRESDCLKEISTADITVTRKVVKYHSYHGGGHYHVWSLGSETEQLPVPAVVGGVVDAQHPAGGSYAAQLLG